LGPVTLVTAADARRVMNLETILSAGIKEFIKPIIRSKNLWINKSKDEEE